MNTSHWIGKKVLVRDNRAGIHVGTLTSLDVGARSCELRDARKIWYWSGAGSCHGIAANGLDTARSKVAAPVSCVLSTDVIEIVEMSETGAACIAGAPVWTR